MSNDLTVAETIAAQIGNQALFMIGAKNLVGGKDFLQFGLKTPGKDGINCVKVIYMPSDTYTREFWKVNARKAESTLVSTFDDIYFDMLCEMIEDQTGLYTSL